MKSSPPVWLGCAFLALSAAAAAQDPITLLPKFEVHDSAVTPEREAWRYAQTDGFTVITDGSEAAAQTVLAQLEGFGRLVDTAFPTFLPPVHGRRLTLIVCTRADRFRPFAISPLDSVALAYDHHRLAAIVIKTSLGGLDFGESEQLKRVLALARLAALHPRYPVWFEEGMAQIVAHMKVDGTQIVFNQAHDTVSTQALDAAAATGALADPDTALTELTTTQAVGRTQAEMQAQAKGGTPAKTGQGLDDAQSAALDRDFFNHFNGSPLIPLAVLFAVHRGGPETADPAGDWAKECWGFTDFCLYGNRLKLREPLTKFIRAVAADSGADVAATFHDAFGKSVTDVGASFRGYLGGREVEHLHLPAEPAAPPPATFRDASDGEVAILKGETLRLEGADAAARLEYLGAYQRGERDAAFIASYGAFESTTPGPSDRAEPMLAAAVASRPTLSPARVALAALRLRDALAATPAPAKLTAEQTRAIFTPLFTANPDIVALPAFYEVIAGTWARSATAPDQAQLSLIIQGARLFPDDTDLITAAAAVFTANGHPEVAKQIVQLGVRNAPDEPTRASLAALTPP